MKFHAAVLGMIVFGLAAGTAQAAPAHNFSSEFSYSVYNPCNGEFIDLTGEHHTVYFTDDNGQTVNRSQVTEDHGTGIGEVTGTTYRATIFSHELRLFSDNTTNKTRHVTERFVATGGGASSFTIEWDHVERYAGDQSWISDTGFQTTCR